MSSVAPASKRTRRLGLALATALVAILVVVAVVVYVSRPQRATRLILQQAGNALGLEITASAGEYRLAGTPYLQVRDLVAREPGTTTPLLRAARASLSLPWATIRGRGSDLTVQRVELDHPTLDLAALQHWLRQRSPGKTRMPTLIDGLQVTDGVLLGEGWRVDAIGLRLPALAPGKRVSGHLGGRYRSAGLQVPFALDAVLSSPSPDAAIGVAGDVAIERSGWRMPAHVVLSGAMRSAGGLHLQRTRLSASSRYDAGATHAPFALGAAGRLSLQDGLRLAPAAIAIRADGLVPTLDAAGTLALGDTLDIALDGSLASWPSAWPSLPAPLARSRTPLPFQLRYTGASTLADIASLQLRRDEARFDGRFRPNDVTAWIGATSASPLPPLDGHVAAPELELAGARLEGVDITLDDEALPSPQPMKAR